MERGKFITFEGCEGSGKSRQIKLLSDYLSLSGKDYLLIREPGGTQISEGIRSVILDTNNGAMTSECELLLYAAARAQLVSERIIPALELGTLVICDRFIDSTVAYQGYGRGLDIAVIDSLNEIAAADCVPDCTVFLNIPPEQAFIRKGGADKSDRLEMEDIDFHRRVYDGYKHLQEQYSLRFLDIEPLGNIIDTHKKILAGLRVRGLIE